MKEDYRTALAKSLQEIPGGSFEIQCQNDLSAASPLPVKQITQTKGKGRIKSILVYPGIAISFHQYLAEEISFHHPPADHVLEIDHCRIGRVGWNMADGAAVYLGSGDLCLHSLASCAESRMTLPLGYYEGISVTMDLHLLAKECPQIPKEAGFRAEAIYQKLGGAAQPFGIPAGPKSDALFSVLYDLPPSLRLPYCKLKAQEILLYLCQIDPKQEQGLSQYISRQTELVRDVRNFLVEHLDQRFTIEELSRKYLINTSTLKSVFKAVYGQPIASYVKECRIQQAMKLLRETQDSIAEIARKVGYETQGKFTKAFKESVQVLPTEYRRWCQKESI